MRRLPAEWEPQQAVMLTWPHAETDWAVQLDAVEAVYRRLAQLITRNQALLIVCRDEAHRCVIDAQLAELLSSPSASLQRERAQHERVQFAVAPSNDTWARDHGPITVIEDGNGDRILVDFRFNGWGGKYPAALDDRITATVHAAGGFARVAAVPRDSRARVNGPAHKSSPADTAVRAPTGSPARPDRLEPPVSPAPRVSTTPRVSQAQPNSSAPVSTRHPGNAAATSGPNDTAAGNPGKASILEAGGGPRIESSPLILEGGAIESDGAGTLLSVRRTIVDPARNPGWSQDAIERELRERLGVERFLWLEHGQLSGDDTDGHIDTLARFCDRETICYAASDDPSDADHPSLEQLADELSALRQPNGAPYRLVGLPQPAPILDEDGRRLPAGYANFLIINGAVLVPVYGDPADKVACKRLQQCFPGHRIEPVDCRPLIRQGGSLHCITMQLA